MQGSHPPEQQAVAEEIEAEFLGGAVGDIAGVGYAAFRRFLLRENHPHAHAQKLVHRPQGIGIALGQVVVHGRQVSALAHQCVNIERQCGGERFAFPCFHLGNAAVEQGNAPNHLHVEVPQADGPASRLADESVALGHEATEAFSALGPVFERQTSLPQLGAILGLQAGFKGRNLLHDLAPLGQPPLDRPTHDRQQPRFPAAGNSVDLGGGAHGRGKHPST